LSPRAFFAEGMNHHPTLKLPPLQDIEYGLRSLLRPSGCVGRSGARKKPAWAYCNNGYARQTRGVRETLSKHILRRLRDPVAMGDPAGVKIPCRNLRSRPAARCCVCSDGARGCRKKIGKGLANPQRPDAAHQEL